MSGEDEVIILNYLRDIKKERYEQVISKKQLSSQSEKELIEKLEIDGLIAHSSVQQLVDIYSMFYSQNSTLPQQCQLQLFLLEKHHNIINTKNIYAKNEQTIQNNQASLQTVKQKIAEFERRILSEQKKLQMQKTKVEDFKNEGLKLVLSQNRRLEFEQEKQDHQVNIQDLTEEELIEEIARYKANIMSIKEKTTGEYQFPMTKSEAMSLLNKLQNQEDK